MIDVNGSSFQIGKAQKLCLEKPLGFWEHLFSELYQWHTDKTDVMFDIHDTLCFMLTSMTLHDIWSLHNFNREKRIVCQVTSCMQKMVICDGYIIYQMISWWIAKTCNVSQLTSNHTDFEQLLQFVGDIKIHHQFLPWNIIWHQRKWRWFGFQTVHHRSERQSLSSTLYCQLHAGAGSWARQRCLRVPNCRRKGHIQRCSFWVKMETLEESIG